MNALAIILEMKALDAEKSGMEEENKHRMYCDNGISYGDEAFFALAERYRALIKEAKNNG